MKRKEVTLNCLASQGECVTMSGTFLWQPPSLLERCNLFQARNRITGILIKNELNVETFMSTDGSMVRMILTGEINSCNSTVYPTNYPELFLTEDFHNQLLSRPMNRKDTSPFTFSSQQDRFLYGYLTSYVRRELIALQEHFCRQEKRRQARNFRLRIAEQATTVDGKVVSLENGHFLVVSGEMMHQFRCRPIVVTPRNTDTCYASLPCQLNLEDAARYHNNTKTPVHKQFFLEPNTRILSTHGIEMPCAPFFHPAYLSLNQEWVQISPEVTFIAKPELLPHGGDLIYSTSRMSHRILTWYKTRYMTVPFWRG